MEKFKDAYNKQCKKILSYKVILSKIMKECIPEYSEYDVNTIINCIETGNASDKIVGITNDIDDIKYDVFYSASIPNSKDSIGALINIEAQKTSKLKYKIHNRALVYAGYELVYQYGRVFKNQDYDQLRKVVSIWICFDAPTKQEENSVTCLSVFKDVKVGYNIIAPKEYDKLLIVIIYLGEESSQNEFLKFLEVLFTNQLTLDEKKTILENDYQVKVNENMQKEMNAMCNLADRIEEKALEKGIKQGIEKGIEQGIEQGIERGIEQEKIHTVVTLIEKLNLPFDEVIKLMNVPDYLIDICRECVDIMYA